jgi:5-methylcytosine-specific restriction enzyme subunit McrC
MADNIKIKNIYYMLSYAFQCLRENGYDKVATENFDNIHDLFAAILARGIAEQVKRGMHRDYVQVEDTFAGLRGKIQVSESIKRQTLPLGKLVCTYDEFSYDSPHNRALKSVMRLLIRQGDVGSENKIALRKLLLFFTDVTDITPAGIRWDSMKYHRNNAPYRMLLEICRLTVEGLLPATKAGTHILKSWLPDEKMHHLYEKFVLAYYKKHYPKFLPRSVFIDWNIDNNDKVSFMPHMKTDILLQNNNKYLIIDTKYYGQTMQTSYDKQTFISGHLYQIYAYVKNLDKNATGNVAGILLYAKTDEAVTPDGDLTIAGSPISLKTLDLNLEWKEITEQLNRLCKWLEDPGS